MVQDKHEGLEGGCSCGQLRYQLQDRPMFTHCCHCSWCQRETGSAFALNALIERDRMTVSGEMQQDHVPSASGAGQDLVRCPSCKVVVFSHYAGTGRRMAFVRVGTLEDPGACPPDVNIYTSTKLAWVRLDPALPSFEGYYQAKTLWPTAAQERFRAMKTRPDIEAGPSHSA